MLLLFGKGRLRLLLHLRLRATFVSGFATAFQPAAPRNNVTHGVLGRSHDGLVSLAPETARCARNAASSNATQIPLKVSAQAAKKLRRTFHPGRCGDHPCIAIDIPQQPISGAVDPVTA